MATTSCIINWPHWGHPTPSLVPPTHAREYINTEHTHYHFTPARLSDEDVDRIARRVVELQREAGAKP